MAATLTGHSFNLFLCHKGRVRSKNLGIILIGMFGAVQPRSIEYEIPCHKIIILW